jgi:hypothetical protein
VSALAKPKQDTEKGEGDDDRALLAEIRERRDDAFQSDQDNVTAAESDLKMLGGDQWPQDVRMDRENDNRPVITQNELPQFVRQVVGDMRAQRPAIKVNPDGGGADKKVAEIYTGIIRDIEAKAASARPYITAGASAARCGIGHWRVLHDYENDKSFDQCIKLEGIDDPFAVLWDPLATNITRSDANYCFVNFLMDEEEFERQYPDANPIDFESNEAWANNWLDRSSKSIRVAEYWRKKPTKRVLVELEDGFVGYQDEFEKYGIAGPVAIKRSREVESFEVECIKTNGFEVLEKAVKWPTRHIPIIPVVGEEFNVGEKRLRHSVIRFAKDAQQLLNYWLSQQTEFVALQPKAPYILTAKQLGPYKDMWTEANVKNRPALIYEADPLAPGAPQRAQPPVSAQGIAEQIMIQKEAMQATTGIYNAALGKKSNETSGVAITKRQTESDVGTSEFLDNLAASIAYTGEIIVDLIPFIYDTERQIRVLAEDGAESFEDINQRMMTPEGEQIINALGRGKYAVTVTTGPSYTTKRVEAAESMMMFVQAHPEAAQFVLDLVAKNMDWPGAEQFAERFKKMLPPQLQPETDDPEEQQARQMAQQKAQEGEEIQKAGVKLELEEKSANIERTRAETQKLLTPEPPKQPDPMEIQKAQAEYMLKTGEMELQARELTIKEQELALKQAELTLKAQELASQERIEMARMADAQAAREQEMARTAMDLNHQASMAMQSKVQGEGGEAGEGGGKSGGSDRGMEAIGMGLQAIAAVMGRPKSVVRGPDGQVEGIE